MSQAMRWFKGKQVLSFIREKDFAHPGEEEAIELCFSKIKKDPNRLILDVGCGLGGTASFIQEHGWGKVIGIDIERDSINYAKEKYPNMKFYLSDVMDLPEIFGNEKFDLFCLFNSFFSFENQRQALKNLRLISKNNAQLIIFDYSDLSTENSSVFMDENEKNDIFSPIRVSGIHEMLEAAGWHCEKIKDVSSEYTDWYKKLLNKIEVKKNAIIKNFGEVSYKIANNRYSAMHESLQKGTLGGCIIYASICA